MRIIILAAGRGSRLGTLEKSVLRVGNRRLINYTIAEAKQLGEIPHVVISKNSLLPRIVLEGVEYHVQDEQIGTMDAIREGTRGMDPTVYPIFLMLGDEILVDPLLNKLLWCYYEGFDGAIGVLSADPEQVSRTYAIKVNSNFIVSRLIEKPREYVSSIKGTGHCIIGYKLWKAMQTSGYDNFVEAMDYAISEHRMKVVPVNVCTNYFNINTLEDMIEYEAFTGEL